MGSNRIEYIDNIKGFAILLVVIGHLLDKSLLLENNIFNSMIYSTHMPLFMYVSGLFAFNKETSPTIKSFLHFLKRKAIRLLLPYISIGLLYGYLKDYKSTEIYTNMSGYWFFPTLFMCMFIGYILHIAYKKLNKSNYIALDIVFFAITWLFFILCYYLKLCNNIPYFLHFLKMFPFFAFGYLSNRYTYISKIILSNTAYCISLIIFIILILNPINIGFNINGFFAIIITIKIFQNFNNKIPHIINKFGKNSLEIYSLHWFLLPNLIFYNKFFTGEYNNYIFHNNEFILIGSITVILAIIICYSSIIISSILKLNTTLSFLLFGIKQK